MHAHNALIDEQLRDKASSRQPGGVKRLLEVVGDRADKKHDATLILHNIVVGAVKTPDSAAASAVAASRPIFMLQYELDDGRHPKEAFGPDFELKGMAHGVVFTLVGAAAVPGARHHGHGGGHPAGLRKPPPASDSEVGGDDEDDERLAVQKLRRHVVMLRTRHAPALLERHWGARDEAARHDPQKIQIQIQNILVTQVKPATSC